MTGALTEKESILCFDLDGPILDVSERYHQLYVDLLRELGGTPLSKNEYWQLKRAQISEREILRSSNAADENVAARYTELRIARLELPEYLRLDKPWPGIVDALRAANIRFVVIAATLRSSRSRLLDQLEGLGLIEVFDQIVSAPVTGEERGHAKAALVADLYGPNRNGWFIGDTETDMIAGRTLGWQTAAVSFGIRDEAKLSEAQPDLMLHSPTGLIDWLNGLASKEGTKGI